MEKTVLDYIKDEEVKQFAELLINNGFKLMTMSYCVSNLGKDGLTHFSFTDGIGFGYVQKERFEGYGLSSEYVPSKNWGSGYGYKKGWDILTLKDAKDCLNFYARHGHSESGPKLYNDFNHYRNTKESGSWKMIISNSVNK